MTATSLALRTPVNGQRTCHLLDLGHELAAGFFHVTLLRQLGGILDVLSSELLKEVALSSLCLLYTSDAADDC